MGYILTMVWQRSHMFHIISVSLCIEFASLSAALPIQSLTNNRKLLAAEKFQRYYDESGISEIRSEMRQLRSRDTTIIQSLLVKQRKMEKLVEEVVAHVNALQKLDRSTMKKYNKLIQKVQDLTLALQAASTHIKRHYLS